MVMNSQELIERDLRMTIGDLQVQLIIVRAQLVELREQLTDTKPNIPLPAEMDEFMPKPNGSEAGRMRPRRPIPGEPSE
jgi:hypothetical protein